MKHKKLLLVLGIIVAGLALLSIPSYFLVKFAFERHFDRWGAKLVDLEKRGLLSTEFGAAWQDILTDEAMNTQARRITAADSGAARDSIRTVDGVRLIDYPSLSLIARLNEISVYSNTIEIADRKGRGIALIRTNHTRGKTTDFPESLVKALLAAEDGNFWTSARGFEFRSYVRAIVTAATRSITSLSLSKPQGTSTITQQVAKLFISSLDEQGRRLVSRSVDRKLREMRIASALRKLYKPEEILEVYMNHCVTSDYGLVGYKDIAIGLFGKKPAELSDAQVIYLARMVKWGRNLKPKIARQCRIDMPRMAQALGWNQAKQAEVLAAIDSLTFAKPGLVQSAHGMLVDCANEYWLRTLQRNGMPQEQIEQMNIINPNSLVRKKGNVVIQLTIDLPLQQELERMVNARGYGKDTTIRTDVRVGSSGEVVLRSTPPTDTVRLVRLLDSPQSFSEPGAAYRTDLRAKDTLVTNVRYKKVKKGTYRRSCYFYTRLPVKTDGQYYAYSIMDSETGELLAYYSRDKIGSRLAALMQNRTPNGSSTVKPIMNALNFDLGSYKPYSMFNDSVPVPDSVAWRRSLAYKNGKAVGVLFAKSAVKGTAYEVHNHGDVFEGCQYIFDHLSTSNNILGTEMVYRLDHTLFDNKGEVYPDAFPLAQFFSRIGAFGRVRDDLRIRSVTGVRVYKELARIAGVDIDSMTAYGERIPISDSLYSVALGTLELTLFEQMHIFNVLYNNNLIERPADHPSLFLKSVRLNDQPVAVADTIKRYHPLSDINNIRPTLLGLHKRLVANQYDGLQEYDIACSTSAPSSGDFDANAFWLDKPVANFAKSGTTDDVIKPFNVDAASKRRTNYGVWNAVVRVNLSALSGDSTPDVRDITLACIGECNVKYTGERDGKTLHKFVSAGLLKKAGLKCVNGYFAQYEAYVRRTTPRSELDCGNAGWFAKRNPTVEFREGGD